MDEIREIKKKEEPAKDDKRPSYLDYIIGSLAGTYGRQPFFVVLKVAEIKDGELKIDLVSSNIAKE